jgi:Uma2 family endonuclease
MTAATLGPSSQRPPTRFRITRDIYYRMAEAGDFDGKRVELLDGEILEMPPQSNEHAWLIDAILKVLESAVGPNYWVRVQMPVELSPHSAPNPDLAIVPGSRASWWGKATPTTALLVVEVSDSTIGIDRRRKGGLYAAAGIADYWVLNVSHKKLEVYRDPKPDSNEEHGHRYVKLTTLDYGQTVDLIGVPGVTVKVSELLPPLTP